MASSFDLEIEQFDVVTAFLNVDVDEEIYMRSRLGLKFESSNGLKFVRKLNKSLYGIKQAPPSWQTILSSWLTSYGLCQSKADPSLYTLIHDEDLFPLAIYVDDCLFVERNANLCSHLCKTSHLVDLGPSTRILGCSIIL